MVLMAQEPRQNAAHLDIQAGQRAPRREEARLALLACVVLLPMPKAFEGFSGNAQASQALEYGQGPRVVLV